MTLLLVALAIMLAGGVLALASVSSSRLATAFGVLGALAGSAIGLVPVVQVLTAGTTIALHLPWNVPYGSFAVTLDPLSALFVLPILVLTALAAVYGAPYLLAHAEHRTLGPAWFFYNLLTASMVLVAIAANGVLFLVAWEVMSLSSFFLVTFDDEKASVREAGWTYLVATHLGTAFLLVLFVVLGRQAGTLDFDAIATQGVLPGTANLCFLLALIGFGTKAGFIPLHVWLPEAHPAAPSHVSAVMSGVMIKTGIYGLVRTLTFLGTPAYWWAWLLIAVGLTSGILGIVMALAQKDLKRLLAYSSVENIGIIGLGLGAGLLGLNEGQPAVAVLGFAGALFHVVNHAIFKGMLFLGAGAVLNATGTGEINKQGGLMKRMPWEATAFLIGAVSICGLPPFNGFAGEFLIYLSTFNEELARTMDVAVPALAVIAGLALIGGLALACFTKAFGIIFLGEPRSDSAASAQPAPALMRGPMIVLAILCPLVGMMSPLLIPALASAVQVIGGPNVRLAASQLSGATSVLTSVVVTTSILIGLVIALALLRRMLLANRSVRASETWGCGYVRPTVRMQYTGTSFSQPLTDWFQPIVQGTKTEPVIAEYFPQGAALAVKPREVWRERLYAPLFTGFGVCLGKLRWLQHGRAQLYVLYIALTMLFLLIWYLGISA